MEGVKKWIYIWCMNLHIAIMMRILQNALTFFGLYEDRKKAEEIGLERILKGFDEAEVIPETFKYKERYPILDDMDRKKTINQLKEINFFKNNDTVIMCRIYDESIEVYSINIRKFHKKKGDKKYE